MRLESGVGMDGGLVILMRTNECLGGRLDGLCCFDPRLSSHMGANHENEAD